MPSFITRTDKPIRPVPAGCGQQRWPEREWQDSCAEEGGEHHEPSATHRPRPALGMTLVLLGWPLVAVIGAALVAAFLPH